MEDRVTEKELAAAAVAPRVTLESIDAEVLHVTYFTAFDGSHASGHGWPHSGMADCEKIRRALECLTLCVVVLRNGFTVTGQSACASPENFNEAIGRRLALQDAHRQIWPLLGFRLRDKLAGVSE